MITRPKTSGLGFTLVEMMATLTIAAILLAVAAPSFRDLFLSNRLTTQINELVTALNIARSEAVRRGVRVTVCKTNDPAATTPVCSASANWQDGFIVFVDNMQITGNTRGVIDGTDEVLRAFGPLDGSTLSADANFARAISYMPSGWSRGILSSGNDGIASGSYSLCNSGKGRQVVISTTGRISMEVLGSC